MNLKILTLNCNKAYVPGLTAFLRQVFAEEKYDFVLLQELRSRAEPLFDAELKDILGSYRILRAFNPGVGQRSEIGLAYRKDFRLETNKFYPFPPFSIFRLRLPEFGLLIGAFSTPQGKIMVGSAHLQSAWMFLARRREAMFIKKVLLAENIDGLPVIFGGDFNTGLPGEKPMHRRIFAPEFVNLTADSGPTVCSDYLEPSNLYAVIVTRLLRFCRLSIHMKVDHIYADRATAGTHAAECRVLPDRVSDHSPVEVVLKGFQSPGRV